MNVKAVRYDLENQPGWVTFEFKDIHQKLWVSTEKLPVVGLPYPENEWDIPFYFDVPSQILEEYFDRNGRNILRIVFLYNIETNDGETQFEVFENQYYKG